jgi:hypothetical protein
MAKSQIRQYVFTPGLGGVGNIKMQGKYDLSQFLVITNTTRNTILYNFADTTFANTQVSFSRSADTNFPKALDTSDGITTFTFTQTTAGQLASDQIQILYESPVAMVRMPEVSTDAFERLRVANPKSMLDADFEYGLQPTKWQTISTVRNYPSVYEIPGTDTAVLTVVTDGSNGTGGVGESLITVTTANPHGFTAGTPITIRGYANTVLGFSRAEGTFIINSVSSTTLTYYALAQVGTNGQVLSTNYTQLRKGAFYTGASLGIPQFSPNPLHGSGTPLSSVAAGTAGAFTCSAAPITLVVGQPVIVTGTNSGSSSITNYLSGTTYYVTTTNGSTSFTLSLTASGGALTTTAGTTTGLTFSLLTTVTVAFASAHGLVPGSTITTTISSSGTNHAYAQGPFFVESVPTPTALTYSTRAAGALQSSSALTSFAISGTAGQFTCTSATLTTGQAITITGTWGTSAPPTGYVASGTTYYVVAGGTGTSFQLSTAPGATTYPSTTVGTPTGLTVTPSSVVGVIYTRPDAFYTHRPFDGGVQLGTGGPVHGVSAARQSKKYMRYQSGKAINYNTGALFAPNFDIRGMTATGTISGSTVTVVTDDVDHGLQAGATITISGAVYPTLGYNGTYVVASIIDERTFTYTALSDLGASTAVITSPALVSLKTWYGSSVRAGTFDDQNGMFWQYDGQQFALVRRSSTFQLAGVIAVNTDSNQIVGTNTRFTTQLVAGDRIVIRGMSHVVTTITSDTTLTVSPDYRGTTSVTGVKPVKTIDYVIKQSEWNADRLDGSGNAFNPSGYLIDPSKMQMIGMQWTWYGAGFIDFMLRGPEGKYLTVHRIRNNNLNTEAYMRTGNQPVRYEVINESYRTYMTTAALIGDTTITVSDSSFLPSAGTVLIENELISYTSKTLTTLIGCTRGTYFTLFNKGCNRTVIAGPAAAHASNNGVILVNQSATPIISHWGSAFIQDGGFDDDRGYIFNYQATGINISTKKTTAFAIRLAPSVSNAIVGDLGVRELINRAQLLLQSISITAGGSTNVNSAIVIEGVLNPQNYPGGNTLASFVISGTTGQFTCASTTLYTNQPVQISGINIGAGSIASYNSGNIYYIGAGGTGTAFQLLLSPGGTAVTTTAGTPVGLTVVAQTIQWSGLNNATYGGQPSFAQVAPNTTATPMVFDGATTNSTTSPIGFYTNITVGGSTNVPVAALTGVAVGDDIFAPNNSNGFQGSTKVTSLLAYPTVTFTGSVVAAQTAATATAGTIIGTTFTANGTVSNTFYIGQVLTGSGVLAGTYITGNLSGVGTAAGSTWTVSVAHGTTFAATTITGTAYQLTVSGTVAGGWVFPGLLLTGGSVTAATYVIAANSGQGGVGTYFVNQTYANTPTGGSGNFVTVNNSIANPITTGSIVQLSRNTYAVPGETIFSFLNSPNGTDKLDLDQLKELTNTPIGGRGTFPNGPDVLMINVYLTQGSPINSNLVLRWGEAQA